MKTIYKIVLVVILLITLIYINKYSSIEGFTSSHSEPKECDSMNSLYDKLNPRIASIHSSNPDSKYNLNDYYIQTAYNACSIGDFKNSYVSTCALKNVLRNGVRGLDFEIYSIDDKPVVATSTEDNYHVKETYNYVPFSEVLNLLVNYAFSGGTVPNPKDPILIHLRFKSTNIPMYQNFANLFKQFDRYLLGPKYSYENHGHNFGKVPLLDLMGKIVIIVDKSNNTFTDVHDFDEYVNLTSNSIFMRALPYYDVKNTPDLNELIDYNKQNMSIAMPNSGSNPSNPSSMVCRETGCQMIAMMYQFKDVNLEENIDFFNNAGSSFVLKPKKLRYEPVYIPAPKKQNPELSFKTRDVKSQHYHFQV